MKVNCHIIEDLLPSYLEQLTSKESNKLIEDHLKNCPKCMQHYHTLSADLELPTENPNFIKPTKEIAYFDKIQHYYDKKILISLGGFVGIIILLFALTWHNAISLSLNYYLSYIALPIVIILGYCLCSKQHEITPSSKTGRTISHLILVLCSFCSISLVLLSHHWLETNNYPIGLQADHLGPFIVWRIGIAIFITVATFIYGLIGLYKHSPRHYFICAHAIAFQGMAFSYIRLLWELSDITLYGQYCIQSLLIYLLSLIVTFILWCIYKRKHT